MNAYGFVKCANGRGEHYKSPLSASGSYSTKDYGDYWVCTSQWPHNYKVGRSTSTGNRSGTAFDLFVHFEHGGVFEAAIAAIRAERNWRVSSGQVALPPLREEPLPAVHEVPLVELRDDLAAAFAGVAAAPPGLTICTHDTGSGKTFSACLLYTSPSPRDGLLSRMPSSA